MAEAWRWRADVGRRRHHWSRRGRRNRRRRRHPHRLPHGGAAGAGAAGGGGATGAGAATAGTAAGGAADCAVVMGIIATRRIVPDAVVDLGERADRREVLRGRAQDMFELVPRFVEPAEFQERAPERHARRDIGRMPLEAGFARGDRVLELPCPPGTLRPGPRTRSTPDPAGPGVAIPRCGSCATLPARPATGRPRTRGRSLSPANHRIVVGTFTATGLTATPRRPRSSGHGQGHLIGADLGVDRLRRHARSRSCRFRNPRRN